MRWLRHRPDPEDKHAADNGVRADPAKARRKLEEVRSHRPDVDRYASEIRAGTRRNNFAANVFALQQRGKRG